MISNRPTEYEELARSDCISCPARPIGLCLPMARASELRVLERARSPILFVAADRPIYHQGDRPSRVFNLLSGWAYLHRTLLDGRRQILRFLMPGAVFGAEPEGVRALSHGAHSLSETQLCQITVSALEEISQNAPEFSARRLWMAQRNLELALEQITSLGLHSSVESICHLLLELYVRTKGRFPPEAGDTLHLPLTQTLIAEATGKTPIHVNRTLRRLEREGVLSFHRRTLTIWDSARLIALSGASPETFRLWTD